MQPGSEWLASGEGDLLTRARGAGLLSALDLQFASRLATLYRVGTGGAGTEGADADGIRWALAIACRQEAEGHVCADLERLAREGIASEHAGETRVHSVLVTHDSLAAWLDALRASRLVDSPGRSGDDARPLFLDERSRLFLARAHRHEIELAARLRARAARPPLPVDWPSAEEAIRRLTPGDDSAADPARQALRVGLARPLSVVTGGPGTGKTTMVARLVTLLAQRAEADAAPAPRVRLLAPTGKAAAAMTQAFARSAGAADLSETIRAALPSAAETIHRALHRQTRLDAFGRPGRIALAADVVVVDEASMVDLELMSRLFEACEDVPRVVLLGDPGQLASVDAGAVLAEICDPEALAGYPADASLEARPASSAAGLASSIVTLRTSHRFAGGGGIGRLAEAIRAGDAEAVLGLLHDPELPEISRCDVSSPAVVLARLVEESCAMQREIDAAKDAASKLESMGRYRVLCAYRRGPLGALAIGARLDEAAAGVRETTARAGWWRGRLLLVTRNAPEQDLWNGDVGLIEETGGGLRALFPDGLGGVRALSAGRLPAHESAIAMSVHKSQGSEFDAVDLVLADVASPLMTRELLYTGVTRARSTLRVHASEAALRAMVARRVSRDSALAERIWAD